MPVNPKHPAVAGVLTYPDVAPLPVMPISPSLHAAGDRAGTDPSVRRARYSVAVVITAGLVEAGYARRHSPSGDAGRRRAAPAHPRAELRRAAGSGASPQRHICAHGNLAPASSPSCRSPAASPPRCSIARFARHRLLALHLAGRQRDVDLGDVLDSSPAIPARRAILLYIESGRTARKFMSAARAAARNKPVLVVKAGASPAAARAAASHTGAWRAPTPCTTRPSAAPACCACSHRSSCSDVVETLARANGLRAMARDSHQRRWPGRHRHRRPGGWWRHAWPPCREATLRPQRMLPSTWSHGNPVDIIGDSPTPRYRVADDICSTLPGSMPCW